MNTTIIAPKRRLPSELQGDQHYWIEKPLPTPEELELSPWQFRLYYAEKFAPLLRYQCGRCRQEQLVFQETEQDAELLRKSQTYYGRNYTAGRKQCVIHHLSNGPRQTAPPGRHWFEHSEVAVCGFNNQWNLNEHPRDDDRHDLNSQMSSGRRQIGGLPGLDHVNCPDCLQPGRERAAPEPAPWPD